MSTIPYEDWQHSDNIVARLNLPNMRWSPEQKIEVYAQAMRGLMSLEPDLNKRAKYVDFIDIYAKLTDNERQRYELEYPEENAIMAGFAERFREEGLNQGVRKGERTVLERQLVRRFGPLSPHLSRRLEQASTTELEKWADKVLDARSLDEVFTG